MFDRSKLESLCDVSVTRIGETLSYGFPQTVFTSVLKFLFCFTFIMRIFFYEVETETAAL